MYDIKLWQELGWTVLMAVGVVVLETLVRFEPELIQDWKAWAIGLGANCVRVGAAAALNGIRKLLTG